VIEYRAKPCSGSKFGELCCVRWSNKLHMYTFASFVVEIYICSDCPGHGGHGHGGHGQAHYQCHLRAYIEVYRHLLRYIGK